MHHFLFSYLYDYIVGCFFLVTGAGVKICCFDHGKIKPPYRESILSQTQVVQVDYPWWISEARCESRRFGGEDPTAATTSETNNQKKSSHKQTLRSFNSFKLMTSFCWQFIYLSMSIHWWCMSAFVCFQGSKKKITRILKYIFAIKISQSFSLHKVPPFRLNLLHPGILEVPTTSRRPSQGDSRAAGANGTGPTVVCHHAAALLRKTCPLRRGWRAKDSQWISAVQLKGNS